MRPGQWRKTQVRIRGCRLALIRWLPLLLLAMPVVAHDGPTRNRVDGSTGARLSANMFVVQAGTASRPVVYDIRLVNSGVGDQQDDPASDELVDVLPPELALRIADADSGALTVDLAGNTVRWNGALVAGAPAVRLRIEADVVVMQPMTIRNQASVSYDGDGDGRNDSTGLSTDPSQSGDAVPTAFRFPGAGAAPSEAKPSLADGRVALLSGAIAAIRGRAFDT